jgi:predicted nuclease of predicted toxin-antitoxin system
MNLLADENIHRDIVADLRADGHDVISISEEHPSVRDETVLDIANRNNAILITSDKDFGELTYRQSLIHQGVILVRLPGLATSEKSGIIRNLIAAHGDELVKSFTVVAPNQIRIRKPT